MLLIVQVAVAIALPSLLSTTRTARTKAANANARALATTVQANYMRLGGKDYTTVITSSGSDVTGNIAKDLGGTVPVNPCTGGSTLGIDYILTSDSTSASVQAKPGSNCDATTTYSMGT